MQKYSQILQNWRRRSQNTMKTPQKQYFEISSSNFEEFENIFAYYYSLSKS